LIKASTFTDPGIVPRRGLRRWSACVTLVAVLSLGLPARAALLVDVWIDPASAIQTLLLEALEASLAEPSNGVAIALRVRALGAEDRWSDGDVPAGLADLSVALGSKAATGLARQPVAGPRLFAFIPESVWRELRDCCLAAQSDASALFIDRPLVEQLRLIRALVPNASHVAVLLGPTSQAQRPALAAAAEAEGLDLVIGVAGPDDPVGPVLRGVVDSSDALLAVPDPAVFNRETLYSILLTSYSARLPVVGYSESMVRAGAAAAVHLRLEDAGYDIAQAILRFGRRRRLEPPGPSPSSSLAVNREVLRSLDIQVDSDALARELAGEEAR